MGKAEEKLVLTLESRSSLDLPLSKVMSDGQISVLPQVESKGLLYLQFRKGRVILTAGRYVGLVPLTPNITVDVRPKLPVGNLSRVLDHARVSIESIAGLDRLYLVGGSASNSILEFLLSNLVSSLQPIREHGTLKEYVRTASVASHPRGRIKIHGTLQSCNARGIQHKVMADCFQQTSDLAANRVLRACLVYLLSALKNSFPHRELVKRANEAFNQLPEQIGGMKSTDRARCRDLVAKRALPQNRSYYYRPLEIALMALAGQVVSLEKLGDDLKLDTFIVDFERVFEQYLRRILQAFADGKTSVHDGNNEGKKPLFDDRTDPPAQPDIVLFRQDTNRHLIVEVKYKDKPDRADINQALTYALAYRSDRVVLVHQCRPGTPARLRRLGTISGIVVDAYAYDLARADIEGEEAAFADSILSMLAAPGEVSKAA